MATTKRTSARKTPTQLKEENEKLRDLLENGSRCIMCDTVKHKDKFYKNNHPMCKSGITQICKECARKIAHRIDKNGNEQEPTKESVKNALEWLNKPFLDSVWNSSVQESENLVSGKVRSTPWLAYVKNIQMGQYNDLSYDDSDDLEIKTEEVDDENKSAEEIVEEHSGQDTYDSFMKNKADVIRLLDYDPFEKESVSEQPFLYSQLLGLLDSNEEANDDMMRTSSCITIVRGFLQASKIDDTIAKLMSDVNHIKDNSATIKSLQDSKQKIMSMITSLAAESCISLKNNKSTTKGENSWSGKLKKLRSIGLKEAETNGFDIETCKGMQQVANISMNAIINRLNMDESEWAEIVKEQRQKLSESILKAKNAEEAFRILLRENIDLRDLLSSKNLISELELINLDDLLNTYIVNGDKAE